jgi:uncharacterized protein
MILDDLKNKALKCAKENNLELVDFEICDLLTYVRVSDKQKIFTGVALTPKGEGQLETVQCSSIKEILQLKTYDISLRAVTLATINAIGQYTLSKERLEFKENLREELTKLIMKNSNELDKIVFIGHLSPVVNKLKENRRDVTVFCRTKTDFQNKVYNDIFEYEAVSEASIVVITGAALIGSTIDALLQFTKKAKMVILAGFSAGVYPVWLDNIGFTHVASTYVENFTPEIIRQNRLEDVFKNPCYIYSLKK